MSFVTNFLPTVLFSCARQMFDATNCYSELSFIVTTYWYSMPNLNCTWVSFSQGTKLEFSGNVCSRRLPSTVKMLNSTDKTASACIQNHHTFKYIQFQERCQRICWSIRTWLLAILASYKTLLKLIYRVKILQITSLINVHFPETLSIS